MGRVIDTAAALLCCAAAVLLSLCCSAVCVLCCALCDAILDTYSGPVSNKYLKIINLRYIHATVDINSWLDSS